MSGHIREAFGAGYQPRGAVVTGAPHSVLVSGTVTFGASGAVASQEWGGGLVVATKEAAAGTYTLTLAGGRHASRIFVSGVIERQASLAAHHWTIKSIAADGKSLVLERTAGNTTLTNPASGDAIHVGLEFE